MRHLGDITKINGAEIEPVWCITGGSPCQDLSVAGKRAGLAGERSGLFVEQIRIVKEMREHDRRTGRAGELVRPRYMVWENVPGALSSNGGEDFRTVLEMCAGVAESGTVIPRPENGKWKSAGIICGDTWSVAWRIHDAKYWGVPQRRKRIALVADFGGHSAGEILFEREGMSGHSPQSGNARKATAGDAADSIGATGFVLNDQGGGRIDVSVNHTGTLRANDHNHPPVTMTPKTLKIRCGCEGGEKGALIQENLSATLSCRNDQTLFEPCAWNGEQTSPTLTKNNAGGNQRMPGKENFNCVLQPYGISSYESNAMLSSNPHSGIYEAETARTLDLNGGNPACNQGGCGRIRCASQHGDAGLAHAVEQESGGALWTTPTVCIEGDGSRKSHEGPGFKESDTMYTLNTTERHAVAYEKKVYDMTHACDVIRESEVCPNLNSRMGTGGNQIPSILGEKK